MREHPRDSEFRSLVARSKLERRRSASAPTAGSWSTTAMRTLEQTLCAATDRPMRGFVVRGTTEWGAQEYEFEVQLDSRSQLCCFNALYLRGAAMPTFALRLDEAVSTSDRQHTVRVVARNRYQLLRSAKPTSRAPAAMLEQAANRLFSWKSALGGGEMPGEEHAAVLFSQYLRGVYTMELLIPQTPSTTFTAAPSADGREPTGASPMLASPMLRAYENGSTDGLLVFVGAVDVTGEAVDVRLSLPKTESGTLRIRYLTDGLAEVSYAPPLAAVHAFHATLALAHWLEGGAAAPSRRG